MIQDTKADLFRLRRRPWAEKMTDQSFKWVATLLASLVGLILAGILLTVLAGSRTAMTSFGLGFLTTSNWNPVTNEYGAFTAIYGTLVTSILALLIAVPLGVGTAIFLTENFIPVKGRQIIGMMVELLAAIPSVVLGLWAIFVMEPFLRPLLTSLHAIARDSLLQVPIELRQAAYGIGTSRWGAIFQVILPAAISGITGGVMLALGRAMGETMAVTMIIGNSNNFSLSLLAPGNTIASMLANQFGEADGSQVSSLMYAAFVLMLLTLVVNVLAQWVVRRLSLRYT